MQENKITEREAAVSNVMDTIGGKMSYDKTLETVVQLIGNHPCPEEEPTPLDKLLWAARLMYLYGFQEALEIGLEAVEEGGDGDST